MGSGLGEIPSPFDKIHMEERRTLSKYIVYVGHQSIVLQDGKMLVIPKQWPRK